MQIIFFNPCQVDKFSENLQNEGCLKKSIIYKINLKKKTKTTGSAILCHITIA